jgi:Spy/CpxP family protein refolding chaperone
MMFSGFIHLKGEVHMKVRTLIVASLLSLGISAAFAQTPGPGPGPGMGPGMSGGNGPGNGPRHGRWQGPRPALECRGEG